MAPLLELDQVSLSFGGLRALHELDLHVERARDRQRDRAQRRRQDDRSSTSSPASTSRRGDIRFDGESIVGTTPPPDHPAGHRPHLPEPAPVPQHDGQGERQGGDLRQHPRHADRVDAAAAAGAARGARGRRARRGGARLLRPAAARATASTSPPTCSPTPTGGAWRSRARWRPARGCCCSTSRRPG